MNPAKPDALETVNPAQTSTNGPAAQPKAPAGQVEFQPASSVDLESKSSLLVKLTQPERAALQEALVSRDPATFKAVYEKFRLLEKKVSYTAFFYYARQIRFRAALVAHVAHSPGDSPPFDGVLPEIVAARLMEAMADENATPHQIHRLVDAYRMACNVGFSRRRVEQNDDRAKRKTVSPEVEELSRIAKEIIRR